MAELVFSWLFGRSLINYPNSAWTAMFLFYWTLCSSTRISKDQFSICKPATAQLGQKPIANRTFLQIWRFEKLFIRLSDLHLQSKIEHLSLLSIIDHDHCWMKKWKEELFSPTRRTTMRLKLARSLWVQSLKKIECNEFQIAEKQRLVNSHKIHHRENSKTE